MKFTIGKFDSAARSVPVTFQHAGVTHKRSVNAVLDEQGGYDANLTKARVDEVALGVVEKIALGAITNPEPTEG